MNEVNQFFYFGSIVSKDNATEKDITSRLQKARSAFVQLNKVWSVSVCEVLVLIARNLLPGWESLE